MKNLIPLILFISILNIPAICQTDILSIEQSANDSIVDETPINKSHKRISDFKIYAGVTTSKIILSNNSIESAYAAGYLLGFSYRKGRYGYWEIGLNYNGSVVALDDINSLEQNMRIGQIELPLTAGFNLLGATRRVIGVRLFGGLLPSYVAQIGSNPFGLSDNDFNRFQLGGRIGVGIDVLFLFLEGGYHYGFVDLLNTQDSNLSQLYFVLGFRF